MLGPEYKAGCPSCSAIADGFDDSVIPEWDTRESLQPPDAVDRRRAVERSGVSSFARRRAVSERTFNA
jgi:hypothetical protein